jgi:hypothetical protein
MNTHSSGNSYPGLGEAIAAVNKRTTDVTKCGRAWGYMLTDWKGKNHQWIFESKRLAAVHRLWRRFWETDANYHSYIPLEEGVGWNQEKNSDMLDDLGELKNHK